MKNDFHVPVTYFGGTGGHFLISFLNAAYTNDQINFKYSKFGDAHKTGYAAVVGSGLGSAAPHIDNKIKILLENLHTRKFIGVHILEYHRLIDIFNQVIKITYEKSDIEEISKIFVLKYSNGFTIDYDDLIKDSMRKATLFLPTFSTSYENSVTCIDWAELFKKDPNLLIEKLSRRFDIPIENFNISNLVEWRKITANTLALYP